jgi:hypothetical protein
LLSAFQRTRSRSRINCLQPGFTDNRRLPDGCTSSHSPRSPGRAPPDSSCGVVAHLEVRLDAKELSDDLVVGASRRAPCRPGRIANRSGRCIGCAHRSQFRTRLTNASHISAVLLLGNRISSSTCITLTLRPYRRSSTELPSSIWHTTELIGSTLKSKDQ